MIIFLLCLGLLIFIHEYSHFLIARRLGVKIEKFSIGFGPAILKWKKNDIQYMFSLIPFGGYVKMAGDTYQEELKGENYEFLSQPPGKKALIVMAGPFGNYILGFLIFSFLYLVGFPSLGTKIGEVMKGYPAESAGLLKGDKILEINGKKFSTWEELTKYIHEKPRETVNLKIERNGKVINFKIKTKSQVLTDLVGRKRKVGLIGITPDPKDQIVLRYGFFKAFWKGWERNFYLTKTIIVSLGSLLTGKLSIKKSLTGPVGIFYISEKVAKLGLIYLLSLIAFISTSLAIFNILPIPVLDGGHLLFISIEKIMKKPISPKIQELLTQAGMIAIIIFALYVTYNDIMRIFKK